MAYDANSYKAPAWASDLSSFEMRPASEWSRYGDTGASMLINSPLSEYVPQNQHGEFNWSSEAAARNQGALPDGYQIGWNKKDNWGRAVLLDPQGKPVSSWEGSAHDSLRSDDYAFMAAMGTLGYGIAGGFAGMAAGGTAAAEGGSAYAAGSGWGADTLTAMGATGGETAGLAATQVGALEAGGATGAGAVNSAGIGTITSDAGGMAALGSGELAATGTVSEIAPMAGLSAPASSATSWGTMAGWGDLIKGGLGLYQMYQMNQMGKGTASSRAADAQLAALLQDPSSITSTPGYQAGLDAVERKGASQGYLGSGNMMIGLAKYAGDFYSQQLSQLGSLANGGRGVDQQYKIAGAQLFGESVNSMSYGLAKLFGG